MEWDCNEVYICNSDDIGELVISGLKIVTVWKKQMEKEYMDISFDIFLSQKELDEFEQPVLMKSVNYKL